MYTYSKKHGLDRNVYKKNALNDLFEDISFHCLYVVG